LDSDGGAVGRISLMSQAFACSARLDNLMKDKAAGHTWVAACPALDSINDASEQWPLAL